MDKKIKVLYIMGAGRSGSTVLDILLGNHPEIESVGELTNLIGQGWKENLYCACGTRTKDCSYWSAVRTEWENHIDICMDDYEKLQGQFERIRYWHRYSFGGVRTDPHFHSYAQQTQALFQAIQKVSGKPIIVDSSKNPVRAMALSRVSGIDLRLIHLVRDGRGVAWSFYKAFKKNLEGGVQNERPSTPISKTAAYWLMVNVLSERVRKRNPLYKSIQIRYEDFVSDPTQALNQIGNLIHCESQPLIQILHQNEALEPGHIVAGNRLRMSGSIKLKADTEWMQKLPMKERRTFQILAGWLLRRYHYL